MPSICMPAHLPIDDLIPEILAKLAKGKNLVVVAEPGSGKTTGIPPACLSAPWLGNKKIIMLEPRRIAARSAASFIARQRNEKAGQTIGYRVRNDTQISSATRLEVVTEGILTRMIQDDPSLEGVGLVIFDEFHERSIHVDLALALTLDIQRQLRPDLRLIVMSATIDSQKVAQLMGNSEVINCPGRHFPVDVRYLAQSSTRRIDATAADAVRRALREEQGDVLVFLPGRAEINRCADILLNENGISDIDVLPLHSDIASNEQDKILNPFPGARRRVILSTNIAETSVTIPNLRIVIDSGEMRVPIFNLRRGISGLETVPVSKASATQRAGRAGRQQPGVCYRLWTEREQQNLAAFNTPEILNADLASFLLELAAWGNLEPKNYSFLDTPHSAQIEQSRQVLRLLGAINDEGKITKHGRELLSFSLHPRLANLLVKTRGTALVEQACEVIAILEENTGGGSNELNQILSNRTSSSKRVQEEALRLRKLMGISQTPSAKDISGFGKLVALAFPDRIAKRREKNGLRYLLQSGTGAVVNERSPLTKHEYLAVAQLDGSGNNARIFVAEPLELNEIEELFSADIEHRRETYWDENSKSVRAREGRVFGAINLTDVPASPADDEAAALLLSECKEIGLESLPIIQPADSLRARNEWLRSRGIASTTLPDLSTRQLNNSMEEWLAPFLLGKRSLGELEKFEIDQLLSPFLTYQTKQEIERLAPITVALPSERNVSIDYLGDRAPSISARLQELFGLRKNPTLADGRIPITIHLLSPAGRPLQVTADLESFWNNSYEQVRKEMQGRYPKHAWPTDPLSALPMRGTKRKHQI